MNTHSPPALGPPQTSEWHISIPCWDTFVSNMNLKHSVRYIRYIFWCCSYLLCEFGMCKGSEEGGKRNVSYYSQQYLKRRNMTYDVFHGSVWKHLLFLFVLVFLTTKLRLEHVWGHMFCWSSPSECCLCQWWWHSSPVLLYTSGYSQHSICIQRGCRSHDVLYMFHDMIMWTLLHCLVHEVII